MFVPSTFGTLNNDSIRFRVASSVALRLPDRYLKLLECSVLTLHTLVNHRGYLLHLSARFCNNLST